MSKKKQKAKEPLTLWCVVLRFEYSAESRTCPMIMTTEDDAFSDPLVAVRDLANWFFWKHTAESPSTAMSHCCKSQNGKFCSTCGARRQVDFSVDQYREWLLELSTSTAESFGSSQCEEGGWTPWRGIEEVMKSDAIVYVEEYAEDVLIYAIDTMNLNVPPSASAAIDDWVQNRVQNHPENTVSKKGLDRDGLIRELAKVVRRGR